MDNKIFILILIIFLLTTPIIGIASNMIKYLLYIILLLWTLSYLQPTLASNIKNYLIQIINTDGNFFKNIFSMIANKIKSFLLSNNINTDSSNINSSNMNSSNINSSNKT